MVSVKATFVASALPVLLMVTVYSIFSLVPGSALPSPSSLINAAVFVAWIVAANGSGAGAGTGPGTFVAAYPRFSVTVFELSPGPRDPKRSAARAIEATMGTKGIAISENESEQAMNTRRLRLRKQRAD